MFDLSVFGWAIFAGIFAGVVVIIVTFLIEKFGGIIGGILAVTPTTVVPASISLAITSLKYENTNAVILAMYSFPAGMALCSIFLFTWNFSASRFIRQYPFFHQNVILCLIIITSTAVWLIGAIFEYFVFDYLRSKPTFPFRLIGILAILFQFIFGLINAVTKKLPAPKGKNSVSLLAYFTRGIFAGCVIFVSVMLSSLSDIAAGIMTAFPAVYLTTMFFLWIAQGKEVQAGAVGPMLLGMMSVSAYAMFFAEIVIFFFKHVIIEIQSVKNQDFLIVVFSFISAVLAYCLSLLLFNIPVYLFFRWLYRTEKKESEEELPLISASDPNCK